MEEEIMTIEEVANYLKVNIRTVYRMLKAKEIPAFKVRNQWRFKKEEVDKFIGEHRNGKTVNISVVESFNGEENTQTVDVPVVGKISCGAPVLAEENIEDTIPVSTKLAYPPYKYYLLKAKGDSMNLAGINDGDLVLVRQQNTARIGDKVVALIDGEATIKEFSISNDAVVLKPRSSNKEHKPIILTRDFMIQGVVVSTIPGI